MFTPRLIKRGLRSMAWLGLALSLLLAVVWIGSTRFHVGHRGTPFYFSAQVADGALQLMWLPPSPDGSRSGFGNPGWDAANAGRFGLTWLPRVDLRGGTHGLTIPLYIPLLCTGFASFLLWRRSARPLRGLCARCGYDLRGMATGSRCPECGHSRWMTRVWHVLARGFRGRPLRRMWVASGRAVRSAICGVPQPALPAGRRKSG